MNAYSFIKLFILVCVTVISFSYFLDKVSSEKFVFLFSKRLDDDFVKQLEKYNWNKLYQITPTTYVFQFKGRNISESILLLKKNFKESILEIEPVKHYVEVIRPTDTPVDQNNTHICIESIVKHNLVCEKYYGMGIENAWSRGYTGKGVVVAVTDVGINADLEDLKSNIDDELCFNFINNSTNVTPENFPSYREFSQPDHGNRCASLIAAVKGNNFCSAGIAYNASLAGLKMYAIGGNQPPFYLNYSSDNMARSLVHGLDKIDIYSNSWGPSKPFSETGNLGVREAIKRSAEKGRRGLGAIQVFPVGSPGNELANNEYTITVSAVGQHGTVPNDSVISASVLTSGLRDGNNITANSMVTTSFNNRYKCVTSFKGVSAATAQVAGIIALALEARPQMTLADVQDILVYSSDLRCLKDHRNVTTNAAGHKFHPLFGFGLLNATKLVMLAEELQNSSEVSTFALRQRTACYDAANEFTADFCHSCSQRDDRFIIAPSCMHFVKTAKIQIHYTTSATYMHISLISPKGTLSVLQDFDSDNLKTGHKGRRQTLTTVHFWDEAATGRWRFKLKSNGKTKVIGNVSLTLFGVMSDIPGAEVNETVCAPTCNSQHDGTYSSDKNNHGVKSAMAVIAAIVIPVGILIAVFVMYKVKRKTSSNVMQNSGGVAIALTQEETDENNAL